MATWSEVKGLVDGENVDAATFNRPISELASRTDYLKNLLDMLLEDEGRTSIKIQVPLSEENAPSIGDIVCVDPETKKYVKAIASMDLYDAFTASERAFAVGMLLAKTGSTGIVVLYGRVNLAELDVDAMVEDGTMVNGQYYLSSSTPGKITRYPTGPRILVGFFARKAVVSGSYYGDFAILNPQHMDIEAHAHRTYCLEPRPAGDAFESTEGTDETPALVSVGGYYPDGFVPECDSNDSNDSNDANCYTGIPYLVICGDYLSDKDESYEVTVSSIGGDTPTSWPCYVSWKGSDNTSGTGVLRFFGDECDVGTLGLRVRLHPSYLMPETAPFQVETDVRRWTVSRVRGRGWSDAGVNASADFGGNVVAFSGRPTTQRNDVRIWIPENVFDLTALAVEKGSTLTIDDEEFVFTDVDDTGVQDGSEATKVLVGGDVYETMVALAGACDKVVYSEGMKQALACCRICKFNGGDVPVEATNTDEVWFAVVAQSTGESLALPYKQDSGTKYLTILGIGAKFVRNVLSNGLEAMFVGTADQEIGDSAEVSAFFPILGAVYRYNIEFDNDLKKHFPPVPARSGSLMLNGVELENYHQYPGTDWSNSPAVYGIGEDSLYWRDATAGRQPWPSTYADPDIEDEYRLLFHFVSEFHSETGPVTSIRPAQDAPITIRRCGTTDDATVGDLEVDVDLTLGVSDMSVPGYKVAKTSRSGKMLLGPVVEKIVAGPGISIARKSGQPEGQGTVTISADGAQYAGDFETVALENAKLESIGMFPYIRFLRWDPDSSTNIPTGFVAKFHVPATAEYGVYRVKFYATVFGEESFKDAAAPMAAGITMDYNILPDFNSVQDSLVETANLKTGLIKPDNEFTLDVPFGIMNESGDYEYTAYDPLLMHNDSSITPIAGKSVQVLDHAFPSPDDCQNYINNPANRVSGSVFGIKPGYTVSIRFSRSNPSDGTPYTGAIGFLNLRWEIEQVTTVDASSESEVDDLVTQTVLNLRKAAAKSGRMTNSYELVLVLTRLLNALK